MEEKQIRYLMDGNDKILTEELEMSEALWKPYYEKRDQLLNRHEWVKKLLSDGGGQSRGYHPKMPDSRVKMRMNPSQVILESTLYHHPIENEKFIHFTSFQSFKEILNSGIIRLYNLHFGNDPNEVLFGSKERYETKALSEDTLKRLFILSLNTEASKEDLTMWKLYANDGFGVGLVFEFQNLVKNWNNWYFGKVLYGENNELKKLDEFHKDYKKVQTEMGKPPLLDIDIVPIYAFHKSGLFYSENEVRLLHYNNALKRSYGPDLNCEKMKIQKTLNKELKETYYLEYPLYWSQYENKIKRAERDQYNPIMVLKEIILGYRHKKEDIKIIQDYCRDIIFKKFEWGKSGITNGTPEVTISTLHNYFN